MTKVRLFAGPMSLQIVDSVIEYSEKNNPIGLIPSRRQVEDTGGYVNRWKTKEFAKYVKLKTKKVPLVRDHGGPNQGQILDDGLISVRCDVESGFDIIHVDPWKASQTIDEGVQKTIEIIKHCIELSPSVMFEVGTEESIFPYTDSELDKILETIQKNLEGQFSRISHAVVQSGVKISGTKNIGNFNPKRLEKMINVIKKYGILSKEHNGDYLSYNQIKQRVDLGLDSINIAPEFGVIQTKLLLEKGHLDFDKALETCLKTKKYEKWIPEDFIDNPPKEMIVNVSGHYCFSQEPFTEAIKKIEEEIQKSLFERFEEINSAWDNQ